MNEPPTKQETPAHISNGMYEAFRRAFEGDPLGQQIYALATQAATRHAEWLTRVLQSNLPADLYMASLSDDKDQIMRVAQHLAAKNFTLHKDADGLGVTAWLGGRAVGRLKLILMTV